MHRGEISNGLHQQADRDARAINPQAPQAQPQQLGER